MEQNAVVASAQQAHGESPKRKTITFKVISDAALIKEILPYLPEAQQLSARLVCRDWDAESTDFLSRKYKNVRNDPENSDRWFPKKLPFLTEVETFVLPGSEAELKPIFAGMPFLWKLTLNFLPGTESSDSVETVWDYMTGGIRPVMARATRLSVAIPNGSSQDSEPPAPAFLETSFQNLPKLKDLCLINPPGAICVGIIHLTAIRKIPRCDVLSFCYEPAYADPFEPADVCLKVLERYHARVILRSDFKS